MPAAKELPQELRALSFQTALPLSDARWAYDLSELVKALKAEVARVARERQGERSIRRTLARAWGRAPRPLRKFLVAFLSAAPVALPTLVVPNALIIGFWTYAVASYYRQFGRVEYIITDQAVFMQLAALQSLCVYLYSCLWLVVWLSVRRRRARAKGAKAAARAGGETSDRTGGRV
jgi:hypothetical protein